MERSVATIPYTVTSDWSAIFVERGAKYLGVSGDSASNDIFYITWDTPHEVAGGLPDGTPILVDLYYVKVSSNDADGGEGIGYLPNLLQQPGVWLLKGDRTVATIRETPNGSTVSLPPLNPIYVPDSSDSV